MAIYHLSASIIKRSAGRNVTAAAAYRAGSKIEDLTTGIVHDYTRKQGVDHSEILCPVSSDTIGNEWLLDREQLWNKVEQIEKRKDAQLAREITIAIPGELDRESQIELVREYVLSNYVDRGMIADINLHHLDGKNPHAHILLTMRNLQTSPEGEVKFGLKNTDWNNKELLIAQRQNWEKIANRYLAASGSDARIDCRSLEEQGSPFIPQIHVGVHAMAMKHKGIATDRGEEFDRIEAENNDIRARLEEIYQGESAPKSEPKGINEDHIIGELLYQNIKYYQPIDKQDKYRQTISIDRYSISKNLTNGINVQIDNGSKLLNFKLENERWVKTLFYPDRYSRIKYKRDEIEKLVEDFNKVIENFPAEIAKIRDRDRNREQESEVGESISNLINRLGANNFYLTSADICSTLYKNNDRIRVYTDSQSEPIYDFKLLNNRWVNQRKIQTGEYSLDNLSQIVAVQHTRFDRGEVQKLELNDEQIQVLKDEAFSRRLDIIHGQLPPIPLNIAPPISDTKPDVPVPKATTDREENLTQNSINQTDRPELTGAAKILEDARIAREEQARKAERQPREIDRLRRNRDRGGR
jgi:hypothetical protein